MTDLLSTSEAAAYLTISKSHLEHNWLRWGLRRVRMGRSVRYRVADLDAFKASRSKRH